MCPETQYMYGMAGVLGIVAACVYIRLFAAIRANFEAFGSIVSSAERRDTFVRSRIEGVYRGRKVALSCPHFDSGERWVFSAEPRAIPVPQKKFLLSYPRPTENTRWRGRAVYYSRRGLFDGRHDRMTKIYNGAELRHILDELIEAAAAVESGVV